MAGGLYERDFIGWTEEQARLLREAAARGVNLPLDWENLAEEIEDLGKSVARSVTSQMTRILEHLLKLQHSPATDPRAGWMDSIEDARREIEVYLDDDPGLKPRLPPMLETAMKRAAKHAAKDLAKHGEHDAAARVGRVRAGDYTLDQVLGDWLPERPDLPALTRA